MKLGRARGFGAPLWQMDPGFSVVATIFESARRVARGRVTRCDAAARNRIRAKTAELAMGMLREAHIFVEGAGF